MPEIIVYSAFQAIVLLDMIPKKREITKEVEDGRGFNFTLS